MTDNGANPIPGPGNPGSPRWATGARFGDRYVVGRLIGEGGWAETYEGQDLLLGRTVALKVLRSQFAADPALVARFEREARISASVSHPNVVTVFDYGTQDGSFFIALQYVAGEDLKRAIVRRGRFPIPEAIEITREILRGLGEIHRVGIVHRDVKPQNVLLGDDGQVRITDFGIAHQELATRVTTHGDAIGTAAYMAPEQAQGEDVSPATDIYAVGVLLYELLTGRLPFNRGHAMAMLLAHVQEQPVPPSAVSPDADISPWLDGIVLRAMEKQPSARFPTAAAMIEALMGLGRGYELTAPIGPTSAAGSAGAVTDVLPGIDRAREAIGGPPPHAHTPTSRASASRPRSNRKGRHLAIVLASVILLSIAAIAAATKMEDGPLGLWGGGGGADPTVPGRIVAPPATATVETSGEEKPPGPSHTAERDADPTESPITTILPRPTVELPRTPTPQPEEPPTRTPEPTESPEPPTERPVPIQEEPTEIPDSPTEPVDDPVEQQFDAGLDAAEIRIAADQWAGGAGTQGDEEGGSTSGDPREVREIDTSSGDDAVATTSFTLSTVPAGGVTIEIEVRLEDADTNPGALSVSVNEADMSQPVDLTSSGGLWSVVDVSVPSGALLAGTNQIVATAVDPSSNADGRASILLGDIIIRPGGPEDAVDLQTGDGADPVTVDDQPDRPAGNNAEPTIAPR